MISAESSPDDDLAAASLRACKPAVGQLHSELAGKLSANLRETNRLRLAIFQVEAVMKMLSPEVNIRLIAPKRRNVGNPGIMVQTPQADRRGSSHMIKGDSSQGGIP